MTRATFDHAQVAVRKGGLTCSHVVILPKTSALVSGIWCSWLSHPLSMALSAGGLRFESGFVHFFSVCSVVLGDETIFKHYNT